MLLLVGCLYFYINDAWSHKHQICRVLHQSHDSSCYISTTIPAPPQLLLHKHTDLRAQHFPHSHQLPYDLDRLSLSGPETGYFVDFPAITNSRYMSSLSPEFHKEHSCRTERRIVPFRTVIYFEFFRVTRLSQPSVTATFHKRMFCSLRGYIL